MNQIDEIIRRLHIAKQKQRERRMRAMLECSCLLLVSLVVLISGFAGTGVTTQTYSVMGAFLLGPQTGGYILVAVIAFVIGILVAEMTRYLRQKRQEEQVEDKS